MLLWWEWRRSTCHFRPGNIIPLPLPSLQCLCNPYVLDRCRKVIKICNKDFDSLTTICRVAHVIMRQMKRYDQKVTNPAVIQSASLPQNSGLPGGFNVP